MKVYTNVAFSKKTMWKGKIVQSTIDECRDVYAIWIELVYIFFSSIFMLMGVMAGSPFTVAQLFFLGLSFPPPLVGS
nr:protein VASCULAR ASSOCIATED DEATH 1, chloroplastic [Ipomoea batatas]